MATYLDTNIAIWLAQGDFGRLSAAALERLRQDELLISPMALLELEYLYELKRILWSAQDLRRKLQHEAGVQVCELNFQTVASIEQMPRPFRTRAGIIAPCHGRELWAVGLSAVLMEEGG